MPASSAAAQNPGYERTTPGSPSEVDVNPTRSVPKNAARAAAAAPLNELCPDVYAGNGGGGRGGVQGGGGSRAAVPGRHTSKWYLQSQHTTAASAIATFKVANSLAASPVPRFRSAA